MSRMSNPGTSEQEQGGGAGGAASQLRDKAAELTGTLRDAATEQYENLRGSAEEYYDQGRQKAQEWQHGLEEYVKEQPVKALLIAAGVGVLLGVLWKKS